jgi:hypothetical protein
MAKYESDQGADIASQEGAKTLEEARARVNQAIYYLDTQVSGEPDVAALETRLPADSPMPEIHATLLMYFRQLEPHLYTRAQPHWTGEFYSEPIATIKVPHGPAVSNDVDINRYRSATLDGLADLTDWEMRSIDVGAETTQVYLSPDAIVSSYRQLHNVQNQLGLSVQPRDGTQRRNDGPSRI